MLFFFCFVLFFFFPDECKWSVWKALHILVEKSNENQFLCGEKFKITDKNNRSKATFENFCFDIADASDSEQSPAKVMKVDSSATSVASLYSSRAQFDGLLQRLTEALQVCRSNIGFSFIIIIMCTSLNTFRPSVLVIYLLLAYWTASCITALTAWLERCLHIICPLAATSASSTVHPRSIFLMSFQMTSICQ